MTWIRVTVEDLETGEVESREAENDYIIVCSGTCYVDSMNTWATGTHQITIKGRAGAKTRNVVAKHLPNVESKP